MRPTAWLGVLDYVTARGGSSPAPRTTAAIVRRRAWRARRPRTGHRKATLTSLRRETGS